MKFFKFLILTALVSLCLCACTGGSDVVESSEPKPEDNVVITSRDAGVGTFYYPDEDFNEYLTVEREFDGTAQNVIEILRELGNYSDNDVKANSWYIKGNTLYIDFNKELKSATGSSAQEYFSIYGTVKTLKSCFGVEYIRLTVAGKDFNTPHGEYDLPL